jgi:PIN domain nuclease of toxin-antitoxin system
MGTRLGRLVSAYLDTHVAVWLAQGDLKLLSPSAVEAASKNDLLISPMVLLELEYLYELNKIRLSADEVLRKLEFELGVRVCELSFRTIVQVASREKWTRDPFDRMIVGHASTNGIAALISADRVIRENYPRAIW